MTKDKKPPYTISEEDSKLFRDSVKSIKPIVYNKITPPAKQIKLKRKKTSLEQTVFNLRDDHAPTVASEQALFYQKNNLDPKLIKKLRQAKFPIQARLDLHGLQIEQAKQTLINFIDYCRQNQIRHALVIHGKGMGSLTGGAKLKQHVNYWLPQFPHVLAFCSAKSKDGGVGALYLLVKTPN